MNRLCILALALTFFGSLAQASPNRPIVILVPGFLNSLSTAPDFADSITNLIKERGLEVKTVDTLSSIGTVEENGHRLDRYLTQIASENPGRRFLLLAHSAGGLYTLQALTYHPELPVDTLVSMATPWRGVEFVDRLRKNVPGLEDLAGFLKLDSMREFASHRMVGVLNRLKVPADLRVISLAGRQEACSFIDCAKAEKLSWILSIAQKFMSHPSDGVVTVGSALGEDIELKRTNGQRLEIEHWDDLIIPLEHWEIVQDGSFFRALGVTNPGHVTRVQNQVFGEILKRLAPEIQAAQ